MVDLLFEFDDCLVISKGVEEILFAFVNEKGFSIEDYSNAFYVLQNIMNYNNKTMNNILHKLEEMSRKTAALQKKPFSVDKFWGLCYA